jgi:hypothetical protein
MTNRRGVWASVVAVFIFSAGVIAQQPKSDPKKQDETQKREIQAAAASVDLVMAGQPATNDFGATWIHEDYLKASNNKEYVPFIVSIDPAKVAAAGTVTFYWRVTARGAVVTPPPAGKNDKNDKKDDKNPPKRPEYAYEDVSFVPVAPGAPIHVNRSVTLPAGDYDVYIDVKEPTSTQKNAPAPKTSVIKQALTVPNFWTTDLTTSSVLIAQRIDPLPAPLTPQQQVERPYALGQMEIVPALGTKLPKKGELSTFMLIYNPKVDGTTNKPDVLVEYSFCQAAPGNEPKAGEPCKAGEKFFNKTAPESLNAGTLPPQFDLAAGHQLQSGQAVPLASFPEGDYRLEIKVTDKIANKSVTRDVNFTVTAS